MSTKMELAVSWRLEPLSPYASHVRGVRAIRNKRIAAGIVPQRQPGLLEAKYHSNKRAEPPSRSVRQAQHRNWRNADLRPGGRQCLLF